ncbi:MAG: selenide, water dikinase SelD [Eubacteriales bacterium]
MENTVKMTKLANCAGCGAKVGAGTLAQLLEGFQTHHDPKLLVGFDKSDDASVYQVSPDLCIIQTVDFFPPIADDPYLYGQIAAANALSDIYAMGAEPKLALNLLCVPEKMPQSAIGDLLRGGYDKAYEAGAIITGGHSIFSEEPKYGLSVTGFAHPNKFLKNHGAHPGDVLILTKPLGIGTLTTGAKAELCSEKTMDFAYGLMATLNKNARDAMMEFAVHSCTDVTGFGLLGHLLEMMQGGNTKANLQLSEFDFIPEAVELAKMGILPAGMYRNRKFAGDHVEFGAVDLVHQDLLFDPQTSGGLLMAVAPEDAPKLMAKLKTTVPSAQRIGTVEEYHGGGYIQLT